MIARLPVSIVQLIAVPVGWPATDLRGGRDHLLDELLGDSLVVARDVRELGAVSAHRVPLLVAESIREHEVCFVALRGADQGEGDPGGSRGVLHHGPARSQSPVRRGTLDHGLRSEEHTSELQSPCNLVCRLLLEQKKHYLNISLYL